MMRLVRIADKWVDPEKILYINFRENVNNEEILCIFYFINGFQIMERYPNEKVLEETLKSYGYLRAEKLTPFKRLFNEFKNIFKTTNN